MYYMNFFVEVLSMQQRLYFTVYIENQEWLSVMKYTREWEREKGWKGFQLLIENGAIKNSVFSIILHRLNSFPIEMSRMRSHYVFNFEFYNIYYYIWFAYYKIL